ncbi:MAG: DUF3352 domain-containing protein [Acidimicrobiia bacterium]|nr:DUF3352 domain-containing protein [Acidimicrobiia bacterium]
MPDATGPAGPPEQPHPDPFTPEGTLGWDPEIQVVGTAGSGPAPKSRPWLALGAAALVVFVIGGGALAMRSFLSTSVAAAEIMSPDTELFFSVDFLQFLEGDARKLNDTIFSMVEASGETAAADLRDMDGLIDEIDSAMQDALGVDFTDDIRPWVGRTLSVSVSGIESFSTREVPDVLVILESRDGGAADQFLSDFADGLQLATGTNVVRGTYNGVEIFIASDDGDFDPPLVFARIGSMVAFGTQQAVEKAIDADSGLSLADNEAFAAVMDALPADRVMSLYVNGSAFSNAFEVEGLDPSILNDFGNDTFGGSFTIADYGVRFEGVVLGDDPTGGLVIDSGEVVGDLPVDTFVMVGGWSMASYWDLIATAAGGTDADDLLAEAGAELGIDLDSFLSLLDGPSAFALVESREGLMAQELSLPLGLVGLFGTSRPVEVEGYVDDLIGYATRNGFEDLTRTTIESGTFWLAGGDGTEAAAVGVTDTYLAAASSLDLAASIGSSPSLSENAELRAAADAIGVDPGALMLFVDTQALIDVFEAPADMAEALSPLGPMAAAYEVDATMTRGVFVWLIDYVEE